MSTDNSRYFHFTLGPVQSFVGQARRTRDFWAGSFLLSWLSGVAILSVKHQEGEIVFPRADDDFLDAIAGKQENANHSKEYGSIPNRFKAKVPANFDPSQVIASVQEAWLALAQQIYDKEVAPIITDMAQNTDKTLLIWQRQITHFWDMNWVISDDDRDSSGLDRRKNWRTVYYPAESGIKCSLMGDWQELSGIDGVSRSDNQAREKFWAQFAKKFANDFAEKETLCAISYVKRRFAPHFKSMCMTLDNGLHIKGWEVSPRIPSVSDIAVAKWWGHVLRYTDDNTLSNFVSASRELSPMQSDNIKLFPSIPHDSQYAVIDSHTLFKSVLENQQLFADKNKVESVRKTLKALTENYGEPSPYYAVLMMDGDNLGQQMGDLDKQAGITEALSSFTREVPEIVRRHNGFLIYAGGDDVLALLTLSDVLSCALAIRKLYLGCFNDKKANSTISAAVLFSHMMMPLNHVLRESHQLLDEIAKERAGRDAIAIRVNKSSGSILDWASQWDKAIDDENEQLWLESMLQSFVKKEDGFSSRFFYKLRQRFATLYTASVSPRKKNVAIEQLAEEPADKLTEAEFWDLLAVDYMQSHQNTSISIKDARKQIRKLSAQSNNGAKYGQVSADFALIIRFLAQQSFSGGINE